VENENETIERVVEESAERGSSRLIRAVPSTDAFAGWGPRMAGSLRDILRGMN
jgi:hypothetical protein